MPHSGSGPYVFSSLTRGSQPVFAWGSLGPLRSIRDSKPQDCRLKTRLKTDDWLLLLWATHPFSAPGGHSPWLTASLVNMFIYNFITSTSVYVTASACLYGCFLQSLCLHTWNIRLFQGSIWNSSITFLDTLGYLCSFVYVCVIMYVCVYVHVIAYVFVFEPICSCMCYYVLLRACARACLYVYVCICLYMYALICVCEYVIMRMCMYFWVYLCSYVYVYVIMCMCVCVRAYVHVFVYAFILALICVWVCVIMCVYVYVYICVCICICAHLWMCTCNYVCVCVCRCLYLCVHLQSRSYLNA